MASIALLASLASIAPAVHAHGDEDHGQGAKAPAATVPDGTAPQRLPDGAVAVPKAAQRLFGLRTVVVSAGQLPSSVELKGQVIADPASAGRVQATQAGVVLPGPHGLPHLGQRVARGEVLAYLAPQANGLERAAAQSQLAEVDGLAAVADQKVRRYAQLEGSVPQKEIDAARAELASLAKRKTALAGGLGGRVALVAPVAGAISTASVVAGQVVDAREALFEIVQPERLLVQALAYDPRLAADIESATALTASRQPLVLRFLGAGLELREQALPLQFRIDANGAALAVGQSVAVVVATRSKVAGFAVAPSAVSSLGSGSSGSSISSASQGGANESVVWVHTAAERFEPRRVQVRPLDATRSVVTRGLADGDRVVVQGAELLSQIR